MMYELVKKILDEAKEKDVDISVAYDYVGNKKGYSEELRKAYKCLFDNYEEITALRVKGKDTDIKVICDMAEQGNENGVKNYINQLKLDGVL